MNQKQQFEQKLLEKAMKDEAFRKQLIENPVVAIEAETGWNIPDTLHVKVLEEDAETFYLVLPPVGEVNGKGELADDELNEVAGGGSTYVVTCRVKPDIPVMC